MAATARSAPTCCRRWTKAASSSTTSCRPDRRSQETNRVLTGVEQILRATPEVESTSRRTGLQLGLAAVTEANTGDISVKLKRNRSRVGRRGDRRGPREGQQASCPMLDVEFVQLLQDMIGDLTSAPEPIAIKLFSRGPGAALPSGRRRWATRIRKIPGVVDVLDGIENTISGPATMFTVESRRRGARRLHAGGDRARRERDPAGRAGADAGRPERPRLHDSRALPRIDARVGRRDQEHAARQLDRPDGARSGR